MLFVLVHSSAITLHPSAALAEPAEPRPLEHQLDGLSERVHQLAAVVRDQCAGVPMQDERIDDVWEQLVDLRNETENHRRKVSQLLRAVAALATAIGTLGGVLWYRQRRTDGRVRVIRLAENHRRTIEL